MACYAISTIAVKGATCIDYFIDNCYKYKHMCCEVKLQAQKIKRRFKETMSLFKKINRCAVDKFIPRCEVIKPIIAVPIFP